METQEYINIICSTLSRETVERTINKLRTRIMELCGQNDTDSMKKVSDTIDMLKIALIVTDGEYDDETYLETYLLEKTKNILEEYVKEGYSLNLNTTRSLDPTEKEWMKKAYDLMILGRDWHYSRLIEIQKDIDTIEKNPDIKFNCASLLLAIKKEETNENIKEATEIINHIKETYSLT